MAQDGPDLAARFRPLIEAELVQLAAASEAGIGDRGPVVLDQQSVGRLSRMDAMQVQAMAQEAERRRQVRIAGLKAALARMEGGEFGECAECGERILLKRLEIDPTARVCVACVKSGNR